MGKKHASQYANFGWLRIVSDINRCGVFFNTKLIKELFGIVAEAA